MVDCTRGATPVPTARSRKDNLGVPPVVRATLVGRQPALRGQRVHYAEWSLARRLPTDQRDGARNVGHETPNSGG
eukprot:6265981-Heterocapsa_arctica.AAC.1